MSHGEGSTMRRLWLGFAQIATVVFASLYLVSLFQTEPAPPRGEEGHAGGGQYLHRQADRAAPDERAHTYLKSHGLTARDAMTPKVVAVREDTPLEDIATLLERGERQSWPKCATSD